MAANDNQYRIPRRINEPLVILFIFTAEQVFPVIIALFIGMMMQQTVMALLFSIFYIWGTNKLKNKYPRAYLKHKAWWLGLLPYKCSTSFPDPLKREWYR